MSDEATAVDQLRPGDRFRVPGRDEPVTVTRVFPPMTGDGGAVAFEDVYVLPPPSGQPRG